MLKTYLIPSCLPTVEKNGANSARDFVNKIYLSLFAEKDFFSFNLETEGSIAIYNYGQFSFSFRAAYNDSR